MTAERTLFSQGIVYRVEFTSNGTPKGTACAYRLTDELPSRRSLIAPTQISVLSEQSRARWIARHPEDARVEIGALADDVARQYHAARGTNQFASATVAVTPASEEPWPDVVDLRVLLTDLVVLIQAHIVLTDAQAIAVALWVMHTHCMAATDYTPYLWVRSATPECGKSTLLELAARLVYRPKMLLNTSVAFLFRRIEEEGCTVFFDEIDSQLRGEQFWAVSNILNAGFKRGQVVGRMEKRADGVLEPKEYRVFGPKALGGIGRRTLADSTASRTIRIDLRKAAPDDLSRIVRRSDSELDALCAPYHRRIVRWAADNVAQLRDHRPEIPHELRGRRADITGILLAIADLAGGKWPQLARTTIVALYGKAVDSANLRVLLLHDLHALFAEQGTDFIGSTEACTWLNTQEVAPWSEFGRSGHGLTAKALADLLEDFDIRPEKNRDRRNQRGYFRSQFRTAWEAYPIKSEDDPPVSAPRAPSAKALPVRTLVGNGSKITSAPDVLRSTSGADTFCQTAPSNALVQRELALGADGAEGNGSTSHSSPAQASPARAIATGPKQDCAAFDLGDPI